MPRPFRLGRMGNENLENIVAHMVWALDDNLVPVGLCHNGRRISANVPEYGSNGASAYSG